MNDSDPTISLSSTTAILPLDRGVGICSS